MQTLGIFVRHALPGRVKSRLAASVGAQRAAELYQAFVADTLDLLRDAADRRFVCLAPADQAARQWCQNLARDNFAIWPQPEGSLGRRLHAFLAEFLQNPDDAAVVIGSDSPTLPRCFLEQAFASLRQQDVVLGPATDGGYYLVGLRGRTQPIFDGIDWGTPQVLRQTIERLQDCRATLALLPVWYDVDTLDDLRWLAAHLLALRRAQARLPPRAADLLIGRGAGHAPSCSMPQPA